MSVLPFGVVFLFFFFLGRPKESVTLLEGSLLRQTQASHVGLVTMPLESNFRDRLSRKAGKANRKGKSRERFFVIGGKEFNKQHYPRCFSLGRVRWLVAGVVF